MSDNISKRETVQFFKTLQIAAERIGAMAVRARLSMENGTPTVAMKHLNDVISLIDDLGQRIGDEATRMEHEEN